MKPNHQEQRQFSLDGGSVLIDDRGGPGHREQASMTAVFARRNWEQTGNSLGTQWEHFSQHSSDISIPTARRAALGSAPSPRSGDTGLRGFCQTASRGPEAFAGIFRVPR